MHAYRGILREARAFFDENTRDFITSYTRKEFRKNLYDKKTARAQRKIKGARTTLHLLERANAHKFKDVISVLEYGYGRKGPRKVEMLQATAKIRPRERVFGNLREVAKYRPAFYAIAERQFGVKKLTVSEEPLKSKHPLNVAKMQDRHWEHIRHRTVPPIDQSTMDLIEERARTGSVTNILLKSKDISADDAEMLQMWEQRWVKKPNKSQVIRYYRALLDINMAVMDVSVEMVPNKGKYWKAMPRRNVLDASGAVKPDLIPKKAFTFRTSSLAGKKSPSSANGIDVLNLPPSSV
ncbi:hypothetical protein IW140_006318 [Coemansia sp. RSA 1813]|nr:hypothetical protein EV178_006469 [Coemansia sp. RSA 1646]KAJ1765949.1 hypothetical protein LPJ74_006121 [Coemansia sp. RSA 1843]KAJ2085137.1 hypothetical protein IW138_006474 [Coemansia sp. RSA 986]KAJ2210143.1 hypothetical protein EV179_006421 [Coemansia sp. RSA 487]KAJ2562783.1 hypothetical protein IW140_006318 [Coemansia sp. RSA 1813]